MKRTLMLCLILTLLCACAPAAGEAGPTPGLTPGPAQTPAGGADGASTQPPSLARDEVPAWVACRIVDGAEEGELLLAELDGALNDHEDSRCDGKSVYRLSLSGERCREITLPDGETVNAMLANNGVALYLDGEPAELADLEDGMPVEISFNGFVAESFPAQLGEVYELHAYSIGSRQCPGGGLFDLCGLYLQVLDDLWEKDPGLNSGITTAGLDLSQAPGELLDSEKSALAWRFGELHGVEVVEGTYEELAEQGWFTAVSQDPERPLYQWEDGCLFSIRANESHQGEIYSLPTLFFDAQKWRSPLGAYFLEDCSAGWPEMGTWTGYQIGAEAIS